MTYTVEEYLLDRSNIQDTVVQLMHAFDSGSISDLVNKVYTPKIFLDYDPLMGGRPRTTTSKEWAEKVKDLHSPYEFTQHLVLNVLVQLSQPNTADMAVRPDSCTVQAYAHGLFYNRDDQGYPRAMAMKNGGIYTLELIRITDLDENSQNPWRIKKHKSRLAWQDRPAE